MYSSNATWYGYKTRDHRLLWSENTMLWWTFGEVGYYVTDDYGQLLRVTDFDFNMKNIDIE